MALKTNFTDDILSESMNGKRQYNVTENSNGTKSLEDATDYQSVGSTFSAKDMNETNAAVNQAYDDMGDEFNPEVDYAVGDYTIRNNKVWKFTTAHPAGAWDESHVKATKILSEARELTEKSGNIEKFVLDSAKIPTGLSLMALNVTDLDNPPRAYFLSTAINPTGLPDLGGANSCFVIQQNPLVGNFNAQLAFSFGLDKIAIRRKVSSTTWTTWKYFSAS